MENTCNYSDNWQPYKDDYDKFEYDIKLHDGRVIENCYPNARKFNSISDTYEDQQFDETLVSEIRFSHNPRFGINEGVSKIPQYDWLDRQMKQKEIFSSIEPKYIDLNHMNPYLQQPMRKYSVPVRTEPKIGRNQTCPCGSGLKSKRCCI